MAADQKAQVLDTLFGTRYHTPGAALQLPRKVPMRVEPKSYFGEWWCSLGVWEGGVCELVGSHQEWPCLAFWLFQATSIGSSSSRSMSSRQAALNLGTSTKQQYVARMLVQVAATAAAAREAPTACGTAGSKP
jgi:hypothetical protein